MVEANSWTFGPNATALRVLALTLREKIDPLSLWEPLLSECPRMAPLGYWLQAYAEGGIALDTLEENFLARERTMVSYLDRSLKQAKRVLVAGHDREMEQLKRVEREQREYRYLLMDGIPGVPSPGENCDHPFSFAHLENALDWADALVLSGFILHRQNVLGPAQLRPLMLSARDQVDCVLLTATNERRLTLGEGAPRRYCDDFRPYLWQESVTHLVSEWHDGTQGTHLSWLPLPPDVMAAQFGESLAD